jgi:SAM-dependent methyltransferase
MTAANHYDKLAAHYDLLMKGGYYDYAAQARSIARLLPPGARVLEVGVGTGLLAERLVDMGVSVVGVDHTEAMLAQARERLGSRVELVEADVCSFEPGATFDAVLSNGGVWYGISATEDGGRGGYCGHVIGLERALDSVRRMSRAVTAGGLFILSLQPAHVDRVIDLPGGVRYEQRISDLGAGQIRKEYCFYRGDALVGHQSLDLTYYAAAAFEGALAKVGFGVPETTEDGLYVSFRRS